MASTLPPTYIHIPTRRYAESPTLATPCTVVYPFPSVSSSGPPDRTPPKIVPLATREFRKSERRKRVEARRAQRKA